MKTLVAQWSKRKLVNCKSCLAAACTHDDTACVRILTESGIMLWRHLLLHDASRIELDAQVASLAQHLRVAAINRSILMNQCKKIIDRSTDRSINFAGYLL